MVVQVETQFEVVKRTAWTPTVDDELGVAASKSGIVTHMGHAA